MRMTEYVARLDDASAEPVTRQPVRLRHVVSTTPRGFVITTEHTYASSAAFEMESRRRAGHSGVRLV